MAIEIIEKHLQLEIYGFSGIALNKDHTGKAFQLMNKLWQTVKINHIENKGKNIWVYGFNDAVFAGIELNDTPNSSIGLEHKLIDVSRYAYFKHIGPYQFIKQSGQMMREEIMKRGLQIVFPYVEIYGDWTNDESKLETELIMAIQ